MNEHFAMIYNASFKNYLIDYNRLPTDNWLGFDWVIVPEKFQQTIIDNWPNVEPVIQDDKIIDVKLIDPPVDLIKENKLLKAQVAATNDYMDFLEECLVEMAGIVYG